MVITLREINLVYDTVVFLSTGNTVFTETAKSLLPIISDNVIKHRVDLKDRLVIKHGERSGDLEKFKIKTKEQFESYKTDVSMLLDVSFEIKIKGEEESLLKMILLNKLMFFVGDFVEI